MRRITDVQYKLRAQATAIGHLRPAPPSKFKFRPASRMVPKLGYHPHAGERLPGMSTAHTGLGLARGALGRKSHMDRTPLFAGESKQSRATPDVD